MSTHAGILGTLGASRKRKEREPSDPPRAQTASGAEPGKDPASARSAPGSDNNRLLAGFLAHEFLMRGTLLGKRLLGPGWAEQKPVEPGPTEPLGSYAEASYLLMRGGAHIPGVVNPTELARWLQM